MIGVWSGVRYPAASAALCARQRLRGMVCVAQGQRATGEVLRAWKRKGAWGEGGLPHTGSVVDEMLPKGSGRVMAPLRFQCCRRVTSTLLLTAGARACGCRHTASVPCHNLPSVTRPRMLQDHLYHLAATLVAAARQRHHPHLPNQQTLAHLLL